MNSAVVVQVIVSRTRVESFILDKFLIEFSVSNVNCMYDTLATSTMGS